MTGRAESPMRRGLRQVLYILAFGFAIWALVSVASAEALYRTGPTRLYGSNGAYLGRCIDRRDGIRDCYDVNGGYTGRSRVTDQGDKIVIEHFGKNLGKPIAREIIRKR